MAEPSQWAVEQARNALSEGGMILNHNSPPIVNAVAHALDSCRREALEEAAQTAANAIRGFARSTTI